MSYQYGNNCLISNAPLQNDKSFIKMKYMLHNLEDKLWRLDEKGSHIINIERKQNNLKIKIVFKIFLEVFIRWYKNIFLMLIKTHQFGPRHFGSVDRMLAD